MLRLVPRTPGNSQVNQTGEGEWHLSIPAGPSGEYRGAQLDDYMHLGRTGFLWHSPLTFNITARISKQTPAGTWGFGFWNDPFSFSVGIKGTARRLPTLPNCAWFFFASPPNHLAFHDDTPGDGMLAGVFSSKPIPPLMLAPGLAILPLLTWKKTAAFPRRILSRFIAEDAARLEANWTEWHTYSLHLSQNKVEFTLDGKVCHRASITPSGPLGLVIWIDNQFARLAPGERLQTGTLASATETWLDVKSISVQKS